MSYILDALRKAEAERERGAVPGLHAQAAPLPAAVAAPARRWPWHLLLLVAGAVVLACAALLWLLLPGGAPAGPAVLPAPGAAPPPVTAAEATPPLVRLPLPMAPPPAPPNAPTPAPVTAPLAAPAPAPAATGAVAGPVGAGAGPAGPGGSGRSRPTEQPRVDARAEAPSGGSGALAPRPGGPGGPGLAGTAGGVGGGSAAAVAGGGAGLPPGIAPARPGAAGDPLPRNARVPRLAELPDAQRQQLPVLQAGGSVYSEQADARMVILNGQVFHEGERVTPDLLVEQIRLKGVVLNLRGLRFELPL